MRTLPEDFKRTGSTGTPGGVQNLSFISREGVNLMLIRSRKPQAVDFHLWLATEVLPSIQTKGYYFPEPLTPGERLALQTKALWELAERDVGRERAMRAVKSEVREVKGHVSEIWEEVHSIDGRVQVIEDKTEADERQLFLMERSDEEPAEKTTRAKLNALQRWYCFVRQHDFQDVWNNIYSEHKYRYHVDLKRRAKNAGMSTLDYAEREGYIEQLYAVASAVCV